MQRFQAGLTSVQSPHNVVVVALFGPKQLHLSIETVLYSVFRSSYELSHEEIPIKIRYFLMNVRSMQSSQHILNADVVPELNSMY